MTDTGGSEALRGQLHRQVHDAFLREAESDSLPLLDAVLKGIDAALASRPLTDTSGPKRERLLAVRDHLRRVADDDVSFDSDLACGVEREILEAVAPAGTRARRLLDIREDILRAMCTEDGWYPEDQVLFEAAIAEVDTREPSADAPATVAIPVETARIVSAVFLPSNPGGHTPVPTIARTRE